MADPRSVLDVIRQRADNATDGPWYDVSGNPNTGVPYPYVSNGHVAIGREHTERDAVFIAAARSDVPRLVAALTAALDLCDDPDEMDRDAALDVRSVIEAALTEEES